MLAEKFRFLRSFFHSRTVIKMAGLVMLAVLLSGLTIWGVDRRVIPPGTISELPVPAAGSRLLVISPHPDDESLGAGGLISEALAQGDTVKVVFVTNGDGFHYGVERIDRQLRLRPADYLNYGQQRQQEALEALRRLGVRPENIIFLGFPDRGVAQIWKYYWDPNTAFASRTTGKSAVPYRLALNPGAPYNAPALLGSLEQVIRDYRPTEIFVTDTYDSHPDHWGSGAFTLAAAARVQAGDASFRPSIYTFVIHSGAWQLLPVLERDKTLLPPSYFLALGNHWYKLPLAAGAQVKKKEAINAYHTQEAVMHSFLDNFERPNELFCLLSNKQVAGLSPANLSGSRVISWPGSAQFAYNPAADPVDRNKSQSSDLKSASIGQAGRSLFLQLNTVAAERLVTYDVSVYLVPGSDAAPVRRYSLRVSSGKRRLFWLASPQGYHTGAAQIWNQGNRIEISLPDALQAGDRYLMLSTDTYFSRLVLGRVPWNIMQLQPVS